MQKCAPMKRMFIFLALFIALSAGAQEKHIMLVMHGGAGTITRGSMTAEMEAQYRQTLEQALRTGIGPDGVPHVEIL
jgi:beta-aspartyl-peptidase (threonine type)